MALPGREPDATRVAERVDGEVELGRETAARAPDGLSFSPFFPPALCWWARTMVASMTDVLEVGIVGHGRE